MFSQEHLPFELFSLQIVFMFLSLVIKDRTWKKRNEALTAAWNDEMDPVEIRIEMYGLGRYAGHHEDRSYAVLPLDLVDLLAERFGIGKEDLIRRYIKGLLDGQKERTDE